jgi:diguanylate cyclase (GGDEF)-like protein
MLDVDLFKLFNDTYGHQKGDAALRAVAESIKTCVQRPSDLVARYGGEEFAVLLPQTDYAGALVIAEKIRSNIFNLNLPHKKSEYGFLTVSVGAAHVRPRLINHPSTLIQAADCALYAAKEAGRNRISGAEEINVTRLDFRSGA